jgi:glycosyltransferase involved in cell wall biosynthesis
MDPKFNILIRSSSLADHDKDRPNMLSRCIESIRSQSYQNVRLIVSSDNPDDVENIKSLLTDDDTLLELNREDIKTSVGGAREFYNLYCNILAREVDEGWLMFIDDDDYYVANALPMISG